MRGSRGFAVLSVAMTGPERLPEVTAILEDLLIPAEILRSDGQAAPHVLLLQISASQVQEAILALGLRGFPEVRAYGQRPDQPPPAPP